MAGISDAAVGKLNSQNKFNGGSELEEDYGLNLYSTFYRRYDPQIGRFSGVDIKSEASAGMSVYQFGGNNPVSMNDPLGDKQTAGLYGGTNSYYNFNPGYNSHDKSGYWHYDNPNEGSSWMDSGDNGGGGNDGGSYGAPDYSAFWNSVLYKVSNGEELTEFKKVGGKKYYNYSNVSGSGMFETPNNDGLITNAVGEKYYFYGTTTKTSYEGANYSGAESNVWEKAKFIAETSGVVFESTEQGIIGVQKLGNVVGGTTSEILSGGTISEIAGHGFTALSAVTTIIDGKVNGWKPHHTADLIVDGVTVGAELTLTALEVTTPVGWIIGGSLFIGNLISEHYTKKSLTELLFDND